MGNRTSTALDFKPARIEAVELSRPLPAVPVSVRAGQSYQRILSLAKLHDRPLGVVELSLGQDGLSAVEYARAIWSALGPEIAQHLSHDGLPPVDALDVHGLPSDKTPKCIQERQAWLATAPFVSVVIATRDRVASLASSLQSILSLDYPDFEVVVVDNAPSTSATAEFVQSVYGGSTRVRYVREDWPGLAAAHNRGLMEVSAEIVAFTDDDVAVDKHWLTELTRGFQAADNVACVTGLILAAEMETPAQAWIEQFGGFSKGSSQRIFDLAGPQQGDPLYPYTVGRFGSGASMAFKTSFLRQVGGFDPALGAGSAALGGDDLSAFFEVIARGYRLVYEPAAVLHHWHRRDYGGLRRQAYGYGVGLSACLTKCLLDKPSRLADFAVRMPFGLVYLLSPRSPKNNRKQADYPKELITKERLGMLHGPLAYLCSRRRCRDLTKSQRSNLRAPTPDSQAGLLSSARRAG